MFTQYGDTARTLRTVGAALLTLWAATATVSAELVYANNFEGPVGAEWTDASKDVTPPNSSHGETRFLGQFNQKAVGLELFNLPAHTDLTISFDLFLIGTWMGNKTPGGPDLWSLIVVDGPTLLNTSFSNTAATQAYPDVYLSGNFPARTGALENNTLNFSLLPDSVYHLTYTFPHTADTVRFDFNGMPVHNMGFYKNWGLDNVTVVSAVPEPSGLLLLGAGAVMCLGRIWRRA